MLILSQGQEKWLVDWNGIWRVASVEDMFQPFKNYKLNVIWADGSVKNRMNDRNIPISHFSKYPSSWWIHMFCIVLRFFHHVGNLGSSSLDALRAKTSQSLPERAKSKLWHPLHLKLRRTRDFSQWKLGFLCSKILNKWIGLVEHLQETIFSHHQAGSFS